MVSVDVKHHVYLLTDLSRAQELCESRGGLPGHPVPNKPDGFCGRKAPLNQSCCLGVASADFVKRRVGGWVGACVSACVCVCILLLLSIFLVFERFLVPCFFELLMFYC